MSYWWGFDTDIATENVVKAKYHSNRPLPLGGGDISPDTSEAFYI